MNDGKIIIDKIMAETDAEIQAIFTQAKRETDELQKSAKEKIEKEADRYRRMAEEEGRKAHAKEVSAAEMDAKKALLQEKQNLLEEVLQEAVRRLENLSNEEYENVIGNMLDSLNLEQGKVIMVSEKDKRRLANIVARKGFILSDKTANIDGGFIVKNGDIEYNYSFAAIMTVQKEEMQMTAANILF